MTTQCLPSPLPGAKGSRYGHGDGDRLTVDTVAKSVEEIRGQGWDCSDSLGDCDGGRAVAGCGTRSAGSRRGRAGRSRRSWITSAVRSNSPTTVMTNWPTAAAGHGAGHLRCCAAAGPGTSHLRSCGARRFGCCAGSGKSARRCRVSPVMGRGRGRDNRAGRCGRRSIT